MELLTISAMLLTVAAASIKGHLGPQVLWSGAQLIRVAKLS
jgi:hypothetical protein